MRKKQGNECRVQRLTYQSLDAAPENPDELNSSMKKLRACYRLLFFAAYLSLRIGQIVLLNVVRGVDIRRSMRIRRDFVRVLFPHIGIRMDKRGEAPDFPCIVLYNHRSYLDPAVVAYDTVGYGVAKSEVANWPIIGYGVEVTGVLFLKRENKQSRKYTLNEIAEKVKDGYIVFLAPEGTSHDLPTTADFKPGSFRLAAAAGIPVVPVAIEYRSRADYWVGADTFLAHFLRRFGEPYMDVSIRYGPAFKSEDAEALLTQTKGWIDAQLADIQAYYSQ